MNYDTYRIYSKVEQDHPGNEPDHIYYKDQRARAAGFRDFESLKTAALAERRGGAEDLFLKSEAAKREAAEKLEISRRAEEEADRIADLKIALTASIHNTETRIAEMEQEVATYENERQTLVEEYSRIIIKPEETISPLERARSAFILSRIWNLKVRSEAAPLAIQELYAILKREKAELKQLR